MSTGAIFFDVAKSCNSQSIAYYTITERVLHIIRDFQITFSTMVSRIYSPLLTALEPSFLSEVLSYQYQVFLSIVPFTMYCQFHLCAMKLIPFHSVLFRSVRFLYIAFHCIAFRSIALCCNQLYCTAFNCTALHSTAFYSIQLHSTAFRSVSSRPVACSVPFSCIIFH